MTYPLNKEDFISAWKQGMENPDKVDFTLAEAVVDAINKAYCAGLEDGKFYS